MSAPYRIRNWSAYNDALVKRGDLTVWFDADATAAWRYGGPTQHGGQFVYSDLAVETCLTLRCVYHLALRQTQGFVRSLMRVLNIDLPVPDYSTLCRRAASLDIVLAKASGGGEPRHIVIDSTGLKVYGEGEWKARQHGVSKRRTWRKLHLSVDADTGEITATEVTDNKTTDATQVEPLLDETVGPVRAVGGDGAYDQWTVYEAITGIGARPVIPPQRNAKIKRHGNTAGPKLPRDEALRYIRRHGRPTWKREHGYHRRSLAETAMFRFKQIIGRVLRSRSMANQKTEARVGSRILNVMFELGRPDSYALARC